MLPETMSPPQAVQQVLYFAAIGAFVASAELLRLKSAFAAGGLLNWGILRTDGSWRPQWLCMLDVVFDTPGLYCLLLTRAGASIMLLVVPYQSATGLLALLLVVSTSIFAHARSTYGLDGSDQMMLIVFTSVTLGATLSPDETGQRLSLAFIAAQSCLSYFTAGLAKLVSPIWRTGTAIIGIFSTSTYGSRAVSPLLRRHPRFAKALCWSVIIMETAFPLVLVLPYPFEWIILGWGIAFHVVTAVIMGLNTFVWAFLATYPAILATRSLAHSHL
jgi:hypothetical protein